MAFSTFNRFTGSTDRSRDRLRSVYSVTGSILYRDNITTGETTDYLRMGRGGRTVARLVDDSTSVDVIYSHQDHLGSAASCLSCLKSSGGGGGIRTPGTRERSTVFKTAAFDHSATPPR